MSHCKYYFTNYQTTENFKEIQLNLIKLNNPINVKTFLKYKICYLDTEKISNIDFKREKINICANFIDNQDHFNKVLDEKLILFYDFYRNNKKEFSCEQYLCSLIRSLHISKNCEGFLKR